MKALKDIEELISQHVKNTIYHNKQVAFIANDAAYNIFANGSQLGLGIKAVTQCLIAVLFTDIRVGIIDNDLSLVLYWQNEIISVIKIVDCL